MYNNLLQTYSRVYPVVGVSNVTYQPKRILFTHKRISIIIYRLFNRLQ